MTPMNSLPEYASDKWQYLTVSDLFPDMLCDSKVLVAKCTKDEIRIISNVLESYTFRAFFNATFTKARNANIITRAFEGTNFVQEICKPRPVCMKKDPDGLKQQYLKLILDRQKLSPIATTSVIHECNQLGQNDQLGNVVQNTDECQNTQENCRTS